jgi:hypothetical protein
MRNADENSTAKVFRIVLYMKKVKWCIMKAEKVKGLEGAMEGSIDANKHSISISLRTAGTPFCQLTSFFVQSNKQDGNVL